MFSSILE